MINSTALNLIKKYEGFSAHPYLDAVDVPTIGYGTTRYPPDANGVRRAVRLSDPCCTVQEAEEWLAYDAVQCQIILFGAGLRWNEMTDGMRAALLSFAYNLGAEFYKNKEFDTISSALASKRWDLVGPAIKLYDKAGGKQLAGLTRRRNEEAALWTASLPSTATPTPVMSGTNFQDFLNTYRYFSDEAHQVKAAQFVYDELTPAEIQEYFRLYRTPEKPPTANPLNVPYFSQRDNPGAYGDVECFASSCAMAAKYHGAISSENQYLAQYPKYGASTDPNVQIRTLQHFGLKARFHTNGSAADLKRLIDAGLPVPCGWLHHGSVGSPTGGGHWAVVIGYDDAKATWIIHDPYGDCNLVHGGWVKENSTNPGGTVYGKSLNYSYKNWTPRWSVADSTDGWYMEVTK